ncbi:PAS domain S-box protein [Pedobacter insulae]|uniref:histidine kinase n=1 Tax=Pedobacter insulae TaxID=414048 RepID=A0A1I2XEP4_9SPHI|nr:PAS domain S-box protein [Pedobacter insulae]SFH12004.1 PAS domain S-box-containing protein [Pedobacter insulae]
MLSQISEEGYKAIFYHSQLAMLIVAPDNIYTMLDVNDAYLAVTNTTRADLLGKSVFDVFPANPTDEVSKNIERTYYSFEQAILTKKPHTMSNYRYDIPIRGTAEFEERYWTTTNTPILDAKGEVIYFIHCPTNVTEFYKLREREQATSDALKKQRKQLYATFMQAPVGIAIFRGPDYIVDLINPPLCEIYGKTVDEILGKSVFDVLSHAKGLGYEQLLDEVRLTGIPFKAQASAAPLMRNGVLETVYLNFVYEPFYEDDGTISGVIAVVTEVTEEVLAKQFIEEAEERARLAVDAVDLGTFDLNLLTGEMTTSVLFANIFGFEEPVSRNAYIKVFHKDDLAQRLRAHEEALKTGSLLYDARVIWPDRTIHWARIEGKVYYDRELKAVRILGTAIDITEQRKAREEQQKLITLVANSVDLMSILNMDGTNSYINEAGRKLLGFTTEDEVSKIPISQLHTQADFELVKNEVLPTVMTKGQWAGRMMVRHLQTGEVFPVFNNCIRIDDPVTGEIIGIGAVMRDQRPELAAKQALADSEQLLRNITMAAPTGLWMANDKGELTYVNQTWLDWIGLSYESQLGYGWLDSMLDNASDKVKQKFVSAARHQKLFEVEFRIVHVDGTIHWCIATGKPQYDNNGAFTGYIGACVDITEQKLLQQQKDDFIGIASHELKTPVTSIKAYTQILERMLLKKGDEKEASMIGKMDAQINRLTSLIGDLLDVTKINSGKLQFNDRNFEFNELVQEIVEDLQRTTEQHHLIENLEDIGVVFGDRERIGQVITNLITNAIKYSPNSDQVVIGTKLVENEVVLCVEDFGVGIAGDKLNRVFEQFYRVSGDMQHTFPGLGLGLYISAEIVKREHGRIWVNSEPGKGSKFCFALPMKKRSTK